MKAKEIQDLIDFISKSGLDEVNIETESFKLSVKKNSRIVVANETLVSQTPAIFTTPVNTPSLSTPVVDTPATPATPKASDESKYLTIKSPMIGTFYRAAGPDSPPFATVGDEVKAGQVVCIIEAMKLFNEIESEISGKIVKILVENASPVEYDQPLFLVEPN
ncbi:MAG: acetyl-CoA carboxylase biotin carboxyl carrier protein [Microscillaceae bacterium]|nr:acetyl-CoA carboxylase biotin carboxyl carrier protein [Microscillaceae bacterium]